MSVSRAFRAFASSVLHVDDHLRISYKNGQGLTYINQSTGSTLQMCEEPSRRRYGRATSNYLAVIGYDDNTAFFLPGIALSFREVKLSDDSGSDGPGSDDTESGPTEVDGTGLNGAEADDWIK